MPLRGALGRYRPLFGGRRLDYRAAVLATNPLAYWRLGETSGTVARDEMGLNHGTYVNAPTLGVPGLLAGDPDTAVTLNGTNQAVKIITPTGLPVGAVDRTIMVWAQTTPGPFQPFFSHGTWGVSGLFVYLEGDGHFITGKWLNSVLESKVDGWAVTDNQKHCLAVTISGANSRTVTTFIDGVPHFMGAFASDIGFSNNVLYWGSVGEAIWMTGTEDEGTVWGRAITPEEIAGLYAAGMGR